MPSSSEPSDKSKPVLKEKNPHNYRKVGFSMIVISVSLVLIGLLVWAIGSDYHFASNIMASQEVDAMTPKAGYQIVLYDHTQPIGAKLKLLDHANSEDTAQQLLTTYTQQNTDPTGQVLLFGTSESDNINLMANAEVASMTPQHGYNIILFNTAFPVGAKLTNVKHDDSLVNATQYEQLQVDQNKDPDVQVLIFSPSFTDNLKSVTGSNVPASAFANLANQTSNLSTQQSTPSAPTTPATGGNQSAMLTNSSIATTPPVLTSNQTGITTEKTNINATVSTIVITPLTNQTSTGIQNTTLTTSAPISKSITLNESVSIAQH